MKKTRGRKSRETVSLRQCITKNATLVNQLDGAVLHLQYSSTLDPFSSLAPQHRVLSKFIYSTVFLFFFLSRPYGVYIY
jgi:hypothetical protein